MTRRVSIGKFPTVKPDEARKIAIQYAGEVARKIDPQDRLKQETEAKIKSHANSFGKLFELYNTKQLSQNRSGNIVKAIFEREFLPSLQNTAITTITRADISKIISRIQERGAPYMANRVLTNAKTFFRWAVSEGYLHGDPLSVMKKPFKGETERTRVLSSNEFILYLATIRRAKLQAFCKCPQTFVAYRATPG